jgi:DNA topoisomerase I
MLGNTPAVCRKCYVHPEILDSYLSGETIETIQQRASAKMHDANRGLRPDEAAVLALLQRRLASDRNRVTRKRQAKKAGTSRT